MSLQAIWNVSIVAEKSNKPMDEITIIKFELTASTTADVSVAVVKGLTTFDFDQILGHP